LESELKMNFERSADVVVCITSDEGDALVPGTQAPAVAEQEANATGKTVTIRNPVTEGAGDHQTSVCRGDCKRFRERWRSTW
jgi:hypothetical protein